MINIAVCDDESLELDRTQGLLMQYKEEHPHYHILTTVFSSPVELLAYVEENSRFDVLLLDVYMPGVLGTEAARELRDMGDDCQIIFLTTSRDHAIDAFSLNAAHYLVKPYSERKLFTALDLVIERLAKKDTVFITLKSTEGIHRVNLNNFVYSESDNHLQRIYMSNGMTICVRKSSMELFNLLNGDPRFYKGGNTYIINMDYIAEISSKGVVFSTGTKIPILSRKYAEFKKRYMDYCCNG